MAHTRRDKKKLLDRVRRLQGQLRGVEISLDQDADCFRVLQTLAACRGALNSLLAEIVEGHVRFHIADPRVSKEERTDAASELVDVIRAYLK
jgi:DNA-binding FrmR family transcriptional regulator